MDNGPVRWRSLVELVRYRAQMQPDTTAYAFLADGEAQETMAEKAMTYKQLDLQARVIAARLQGMTTPGNRALLVYPTGLDFISAFLGCLYAGVVAVPTYPPRHNRLDPRFGGIASDAGISVVLTTGSILYGSDSRLAKTLAHRNLRWLTTDDPDIAVASDWQMPDIGADTLAFLQYTSGSTGSPKGVMVSHGNLLYNQEMIKQGFGHGKETIFVGWLPLFHDMGLVGSVLQPLYLGIRCTLLSPIAFLQKPVRWLQAISRYRATTSGGPNFAYELCIGKVTLEQMAGLDLGSWTVAFSGAEPVRAETLERFSKTFAPRGFRREAFYPCYGMAETTLFVSGGSKAAPPVVYRGGPEPDRAAGAPDAKRALVGCGRTWLDQKIMIVDPESLRAYPDQQVGEIWVSGKNIAQGYWGRLDETRRTFHACLADTGPGKGNARPFLRTGDLGFFKDGELFVTGRLKDLIIIRGQNHYPQDIELTVERCHGALGVNGGAAFSVEDTDGERLVIVQEVQRTHLRRLNTEEVFSAIRRAVLRQHELTVHAISLLRPGQLPKTSSGKVRRHACRDRFLAKGFSPVGEWTRSEYGGGNRAGSAHLTEGTITGWLLARIGQLADVPPDEIDPRRSLAHYGLDSASAVSLSGDLGEWLGEPLSSSIIYDYPTIDALTQYLVTSRISNTTMGERDFTNEMARGNQDETETPVFFRPDFRLEPKG
uniref:Acyl-CoA synthetase (AMP-forming)/AMP-acid ligase II n=1 Tax=Candidatus Kentrum sp. FW TaxID=2126338 RepID=A0A450U0K3_9GAMM|nr:MAG: Acyl-CoA synthetase (AMP-forming)/AMP-acid ligase II [Candidatus Kentron sp. FW]